MRGEGIGSKCYYCSREAKTHLHNPNVFIYFRPWNTFLRNHSDKSHHILGSPSLWSYKSQPGNCNKQSIPAELNPECHKIMKNPNYTEDECNNSLGGRKISLLNCWKWWRTVCKTLHEFSFYCREWNMLRLLQKVLVSCKYPCLLKILLRSNLFLRNTT